MRVRDRKKARHDSAETKVWARRSMRRRLFFKKKKQAREHMASSVPQSTTKNQKDC